MTLLYELPKPFNLNTIKAVCRFWQIARGADPGGQSCHSPVIAREARPAIAHGTSEVLGSDAAIETQSVRDYVLIWFWQFLA